MSLFNKKSASEPAAQPDKPGKNKLSLLILVVLLAVFGYLYFFTSLIVPHGAPPAAPPAPPPQVKQAMPPRSADVAAPAGEVKPGAPVPAPPGAAAKAPPAPTPAPAAKVPPAPGPAAKAPPAPVPAAKAPSAPVPATVAKAPAAPAAKATPVAQQPVPPVPAKAQAKPAPQVKKAEQKPAPEAVAGKEKKPPETAQMKKTVKSAAPVKKRKELFTLNLGELPAGAQVSAAEDKLHQLKIKPVTKRQTQKARQMNRLFYNAYSEYDTYSAELDKLKKLAGNAFAIEKDGKYYIYTGSYSSAELARKEQKRLSASGVKVALQKVKLPLSLVHISAGEFSARADADRAAARLHRQGLKATVVPKKK